MTEEKKDVPLNNKVRKKPNIKNMGVDIDKRKIALSGAIKTVGEQSVVVKLHPTVSAKFNVRVEVE